MIDRFIWAIIGVALFAVMITTCGCYTERKARYHLQKATSSYPAIGAEFCSDKYPCLDSVHEHT